MSKEETMMDLAKRLRAAAKQATPGRRVWRESWLEVDTGCGCRADKDGYLPVEHYDHQQHVLRYGDCGSHKCLATDADREFIRLCSPEHILRILDACNRNA